MITIYSQPDCRFCILAKTWLADRDFPFEEINIREDSKALAFIQGNGHRSVPQLYLGEQLLVEGGFAGLQTFGEEKLRAALH